MNAQTLFKDGLLMIFSFLPFGQLSLITRTCRGWLEAVKQERSRGIILSHYAVDLLDIPHRSCLSHHITSLVLEPRRQDQRDRTLAEFSDVMKRLPGLQLCRVRLNDSTTPTQPIYLSTALNELHLFLNSITREGLLSIMAATTGSTHLTHLTLKADRRKELDLSPLRKCLKLTHLVIQLLPINDFSDSNCRSLITDIAAIPNLFELDLYSGSTQLLEVILTCGISLPNLRRFDLSSCQLRRGMLAKLAQFVPNIEELNPWQFRASELHHCAKFPNLTSIHFTYPPADDDGSNSSVNPLPLLVDCSKLTHLYIDLNRREILESDWSTLFRAVPTLTSLELGSRRLSSDFTHLTTIASQIRRLRFSYCGYESVHLLLLQQFTNCTSLITDPQSFAMKFDDLKNRFDDRTFMPQLTYCRLVDGIDENNLFEWDEEAKINTDTYRIRRSQTNPINRVNEARQPQPLVGIELNPGPFISTVSTTLSSVISSPQIQPRALFKDGLHMIYSYLTNRDWFASIKTCHFWLSAGHTTQTRQLTLFISPNSTLPLLGHYSLIHHITRLTQCPRHSSLQKTKNCGGLISPQELVRLSTSLVGLKEILDCDLIPHSLDLSFESVAGIEWPKHLQTLELDCLHHPYPHLLEAITQIDSLTTLSLINYSGVIASSLVSLHGLTRLTLNTRVYEGSPCHDLKVTTQQWMLDQLPRNITYLNYAQAYPDLLWDCLERNSGLNLKELDFRYTLHKGELIRLSALTPDVTTLKFWFNLTPGFILDLSLLHQFHSLSSLTLKLGSGSLDLRGSLATALLPTSPQLTHLGLHHQFFGLNDWSLLAPSFSQLRSLTLHFHQDLNYLILLKDQLKKLRLLSWNRSEVVLADWIQLVDLIELEELHINWRPNYFSLGEEARDQIYQVFNDPMNLPKLKYFSFEFTSSGGPFIWDQRTGLNVDNYRIKPPMGNSVVTIPPEPLLVGIELNPGPFSIDLATPVVNEKVLVDAIRTVITVYIVHILISADLNYVVPLKTQLQALKLFGWILRPELVLNNLIRLTELEVLHIKWTWDVFILREFAHDQIQQFFNDPHKLPKLKYFSLQSTSHGQPFIWDQRTGLNVDNYRLKPATVNSLISVHPSSELSRCIDINPHPWMYPSADDGVLWACMCRRCHQTITDINCPLDAFTMTFKRHQCVEQSSLAKYSYVPPATQLVGIELNPGPIRSPSNSSTTATKSTSVARNSPSRPVSAAAAALIRPRTRDTSHSSATTISRHFFKDGLLCIYAFLSLKDWSTAARTSHYWSQVAASDTIKRNYCWRLNSSRTLPRFHLRMHISKLATTTTPINMTQLVDMIHRLPALTSLNVKLTKDPPVNHLQSLTIQWPRRLRELYLNLDFNDQPDLIQSICGQTMSDLQILHITRIPLTSLWSSYSHLPDLLQLTDLSLDTGLLDHIDIIREASWSKLPPLLTHLNLCYGRSLESLLSMSLPNIVFLDLSCRELRRDDLMKLVGCVPNLTDASPSCFFLNDFSHLQLFTQLTSITIERKLQGRSGLNPDNDELDHYEQILIANLVRLTNLTSLRFDSWVPCRLSSWLALSTDLIHLRSLAVNLATLERYNFNPNLFTQFPHLQQLHFTDDFQQDQEFNSIKEFFSSPKQLPNLNRLEIGASREGSKYYFLYDRSTGTNVHDYRQPPTRAVARPAPKKDLTRYGVEANPGPSFGNPLTSLYQLTTYLTKRFRPTFVPMSTLDIPFDLPPPFDASLGQLLFSDGLHLIYSYLSSSDWSHAITCCRQWYSAAVKEPPRQMRCPFDWNTGRLAIQPQYRFNRHLVGLEWSGVYPRFSFDQLIRTLTTLSYLTTLFCYIPVPSRMSRLWSYLPLSQSDADIIPHWPQHLHTILINFNDQSYPTLTETIPTIASLTSCTLRYPTEEDGADFLQLIRSHQQLTNLTILTYARSDLLALGQIYDLPIQLTSLNINERISPNMTQMQLPHLQKIVVRRYEPGMLQAIHPAAPNLLIIPECVFDLGDAQFLSLFTSLTTLSFYHAPIHPPGTDMETILVDGLIRCPSLTELQFSHHVFMKPQSWRRLADESTTITRIIFNEGVVYLDESYLLPLVPFPPRLHHLSITCYNYGSIQEFEQFLHSLTTHFQHLRSFEFRQCTFTGFNHLTCVKDYLASPDRLPQLTHLSLSDFVISDNPIQFQWTKVVDQKCMKDAAAVATYRASI